MVFTLKEFYVYRHVRLDTGLPFYIGKGKYNRAFSKKNRNIYWKRTVKFGYKIDIILKNLSELEAFSWEIRLISLYKKYNLCKCNLTSGGEGTSGVVYTDERKKQISLRVSGTGNPMYGKTSAMKGKVHSEKSKLKISNANKGRKHPPMTIEHRQKISNFHKGKKWNLGKKLPIERKIKISEFMKNRYNNTPNPLIGRKIPSDHKLKISLSSPKNKKVIDIVTGLVYNNIREAAGAFGVKRCTLKGYLSGRRTNKTTLQYLKDKP
jgi:hypothetical protein